MPEQASKQIDPNKVMAAKCKTCPFQLLANGQYRDPYLAEKVIISCITEGNQHCHHPKLKGKVETHICRGARNYQIEIFHRMGVIESPTDEAWANALNKLGDER